MVRVFFITSNLSTLETQALAHKYVDLVVFAQWNLYVVASL